MAKGQNRGGGGKNKGNDYKQSSGRIGGFYSRRCRWTEKVEGKKEASLERGEGSAVVVRTVVA